MKLEQWNNLSDEKKNHLIAESRGWKQEFDNGLWVRENGDFTGYVVSESEADFHDFPYFNPMGDMNLCMELLEGFAYVGIFKMQEKWRTDLGNKDSWFYGIESNTIKSAICTAYAKAVGIITEE